MFTVVALEVDVVTILKRGDVVEPAAIVTEAGTLTSMGFELVSDTTAPPGGAAPLKTT
jgi:hypothetical protein